jgi:hypothetical protein
MAVINIQTLDQRMAQIRRRLLQNNSNDFSVAPGSAVADLFISPQAVSDVQQNAISYLVATSLSIVDILALKRDTNTLNLVAQALNTTVTDVLAQLSEFLDNWGENFSDPRKQPTKAGGTVKFGRVNPPTADITVGIATVVSSSGGVEYQTQNSVTMYAAGAGSYFDPVLLLYVIEAPVEAINNGANGNAPSGSVNTIVTSVDGLTFVTNTAPFTGGSDLETDEAYGARLLLKWQAVGKLTQAGVELSVFDNVNGIQDVYVAKTGDPLSVRGAGKTDIYFKGEQIAQATEIFTAYNNPDFPNSVLPSNRPVLSLVSVDSGSAVLRQDPGGALGGSVQSKDCIQFTTAPVFPVQVTYTYDARVAEVQNVFNDPANAPLNQLDPVDTVTAVKTPILAKRAQPIDADYGVTISVVPGQSAATVKANVALALSVFSDAMKMGPVDGIMYLTDLNQIVEEVSGVLRITKVTQFAPAGQAGVVDSITPDNRQYVRLRNITVF